MKFLVCLVLIGLLSFVACLYFPWWSIAIAALLVSVLLDLTPWKGFLAGFLSLFFLWALLALFISVNNNHILAHRVSLLMLKTDSPFLLILLTSFIGGLVAGFAALAGSYLRREINVMRQRNRP